MNLSKTFQANISKEMREKQFAINSEREKYYDEVSKKIDTPKEDSGEKKSVLNQLREYKEISSKQPHNAKKHHRELEH